MKANLKFLFCFSVLLIVFIFYAHTINYQWKHFDEQIIYKETVVPIANSFSEILEYIKYFGLNNHFEASNPFYSSISNIRRVPLDNLFTMITFYLFKKSALTYHVFSLFLHLFNTLLLFLILDKISLVYSEKNFNKARLFLISLLTLLWALHPTNVESILFTTNWSVVLTYSLCLYLLFFFLKKGSTLNHLILFVVFLICQGTREYPIVIPVIFFLYIYASYLFNNPKTKISEALSLALSKTFYLFIIAIIFVLYSLSSPLARGMPWHTSTTIERIFWFSPHIFVHFIKLIIFPLHLSIDQTAMVRFGKTLFDPYSIFCFIFMYSFLLLLVISLIFIRKKAGYFFFISFFPFVASLIPFLHILSPAYCIISERYLYFPLAMLIFGISHFIFSTISRSRGIACYTPTLVILFIVVSLFSSRTYFRTFVWKDSITLFTSALKESPNDLFSALRISMLGSLLSDNSKIKSKNYAYNAVNILEGSINKLEEEKKSSEDKIPKIIRTYGLDPKTLQAKTAYLLALTKLGIDGDLKKAYELLSPYMQDFSITDTQILDLYFGLLFATGNLDEAEGILNDVKSKKTSPTFFITLAELSKRKYNNFSKAEEYLKESFLYFPYDTPTISSLKQLYFQINKPYEFALFSYLHGIRTHSKQSLDEAFKVFTLLNNKEMTNKITRSIELLAKN